MWKATVWGVRGSIPMASAEFLKYGGNTSCVSVDCGGTLVVLDAGSGIVRLGEALSGQKGQRLHLLFSHLHLDHVLGLPCFAPLHDPAAEIHLYGQAREGESFQSRLERLIGPPYWPLGLGDFPARVILHEVGPGEQISLTEGLTADTMPGNHPNESVMYRLEGAGKRLTYTLDCELDSSLSPRLTEFCRDSGLLIWDAHFTGEDLQKGWGHSTWEQGAALGRAANAGVTLMTHFSPAYTDSFLEARERLAEKEGVRFAKEGMEIVL